MGEHIPRQRAMVVRERLIQMAGTASPEDCDALIDAARMVEAVIYARAMAASSGLTMRKLAGIMGVSPTTLSQWTATFPTTPPDMMRKASNHSATEDDTQRHSTTGDAMTAIELIDAERSRQITEEGWTLEHDDKHNMGELAHAAACYCLPPEWVCDIACPGIVGGVTSEGLIWPWGAKFYKRNPNDRIRELVKAGALIVAEIERLQRAGK